MNTAEFKEFIAGQKKHLYIETKIVHKVVKALRAAGDPVVSVYDGELLTEARKNEEIDNLVFNLDECFLNTASGGWVRIVLGNDWDALVDYTLNLEAALQPVNDWIDEHN